MMAVALDLVFAPEASDVATHRSDAASASVILNSLENLRGTTNADHDEIHREWHKI